MGTLSNLIACGMYGAHPASAGNLPAQLTDASVYTFTHIGNLTVNTFGSVAVSKDGTHMMVGQSSANTGIYEYELTTPYMVNTMSFLGARTSVGTGVGGMAWSDDGTKFFCSRDAGATSIIYGWTCTTPYTTAGYTSDGSIDLSAQMPGNVNDMSINADMTKAWFTTGVGWFEYNFLTPGDVTTLSYVKTASFAISCTGHVMGPDGNKAVIARSTGIFSTINLGTPFDIATFPGTVSSTNVAEDRNTNMIGMDLAGPYLYLSDSVDDTVFQYGIP